MRRLLAAGALLLAFLALTATAHAGHGLKSWIENYYLDHPAPAFAPVGAPNPAFQSGGENATWDLIESVPTGNPHTDLDFFTQGGQTFASVGTLATGPNGGGQTIVRLMDAAGKVDPQFVAGHPSATCISNPDAALSLQHDVEAAPKGNAILNETNASADRTDTQLLVDATDDRGRCHDERDLGLLSPQPRGGLELIDVTNINKPQEIGLTSHSGEAHTVNVDPKRPHIAYAVTSDGVNVTSGVRQNENPASGERFDLDGFEVVDMSSCMNFPVGTLIVEKRAECRPEVYRYRYPSLDISLGHEEQNTVYGCHELEVYENDLLSCGSGTAAILFDMSEAFDDMGTPNDYSDDKPEGTPLPCRVRAAESSDPILTDAKVTDCVDGTGEGEEDLNIANWLANGAPSLEGVDHVGSVHHMGRNGTHPVTEDNEFNHETELTDSGNFLLATDERGGGVSPPGASCDAADANHEGNGGVHAYQVDELKTGPPGTALEEWEAYARTSENEKAIYRAPVRTGVQATICTAHVFQQIPGQNRIFMGWYSQGTQVVDFTENADGTIDFKEAAYFIPVNANEWVSHVFECDRNTDGTFTYYGATGDFSLGQGRNTIDVWKVTMPPPEQMSNQDFCGAAPAGGRTVPAGNTGGGGGGGTTTEYPLPTGSSKRCMGRRAKFVRRGLGRFRLRLRRSVVHRRAGQPGSTRRNRRVYRYCVTRDRRGKVIVAFGKNRVRLVASTARGHRRGRIGRGTRTSRLARSSRTTLIGRGLWASSNGRFVYGTRRGRVRYVAVLDRGLAGRPGRTRAYLRLAGLRR
jgi:hypothetical protein